MIFERFSVLPLNFERKRSSLATKHQECSEYVTPISAAVSDDLGSTPQLNSSLSK